MSNKYDGAVSLTPQVFSDIIDARHESMQEFGVSLAKTLLMEKPFTRAEISMLRHGKMPITAEIQHGALALAAGVESAAAHVSQLHPAQGVSSVHDIDGAVVLGQKVKCASPVCPVWFVGVTPTQKFHSPKCEATLHELERAAAQRERQLARERRREEQLEEAGIKALQLCYPNGLPPQFRMKDHQDAHSD